MASSEDTALQSERQTVMLTADEMADLRLVAGYDRMTLSEALRQGVTYLTQRAAVIRSGRGV